MRNRQTTTVVTTLLTITTIIIIMIITMASRAIVILVLVLYSFYNDEMPHCQPVHLIRQQKMPTASPGTAEWIPKDQLLVVVDSSAQASLQRCRLDLSAKTMQALHVSMVFWSREEAHAGATRCS